MKTKIGPIALAGMLPLLSTAALAQVAQPGAMRGDISGFHGTAESLPDAIDKIERASGGKVVEIRFTEVAGSPAYHAVVVKGSDVTFLRLEAQSGALKAVARDSEPVWMLNWRARAEIRYAETAQVPLSAAIWKAEKMNGDAPAIAAGIARSASNPSSNVHAYNILIEGQGVTKRLAVDDATGEVISDPGALSGLS